MATTKKSAPKRKATTTAKKPRANASKPATKRTRRSSSASMQSFRLQKSNTPFMTFAITRQTVYWVIILAAVVAVAAWILYLHDKVNQIYDQVDANTMQLELLPEEVKAAKDAKKKS